MTWIPSVRKTSSNGCAELRVAVVDQEAHRPLPSAAVDHEVARLLGDPCPARVLGDAGEANPARVELDEEQHVEAPQPHRVDGQEVARDHALRLRAQERPPRRARPPRRRRDPAALQHRAHRRRGNPQPELAQLADDPPVAPARVLAREPQNQLLEFRVERRPTEPTARVGPAAGHQPAMPAQQRLRADRERRPRRSRQRPAQRREQRAISRARSRPSELAPRDRELVAEHQDLDLLALARAQPQREQLKHSAYRPIEERPEHAPPPQIAAKRRGNLTTSGPPSRAAQARNRLFESPLNTPGSPQSKPSSARNRTVSSRSSTTSPTWTKLVTPGRWLSIEVKRLARDRRAAGVVRISAARAAGARGAPLRRRARRQTVSCRNGRNAGAVCGR